MSAKGNAKKRCAHIYAFFTVVETLLWYDHSIACLALSAFLSILLGRGKTVHSRLNFYRVAYREQDMTMNEERVRVLIVEDQPTFRHDLEQALSQYQDIEIVDSFDTSQYTVSRVGWRPVDVIIADLTWQGDPYRGLQLIQYTLDLSPQIKVIVYSVCVDQEIVRQTILAGVDGYLIKGEIDFPGIAWAIKSVQRNVPAYSHSIIKVMVKLLREGANSMRHTEVLDRLTRRERQVAALLARGFSNTQVAQQLGIGTQTVKVHVSHVLQKLDLSSRHQLKDCM